VAAEADEELRKEFRETVADLKVEDFIFVDEMGANISMTRTHGRAPGGERVVEKVPRNHGKNLSTIGAMGLRDVITTMSIEGAVDNLAFNAFTEKMLVPKLKPGQIVFMDNLKVHLSPRVEELISRAKAHVIYLPTYSPDFNPIENLWSKVKEFLRAAKARTKRKLLNAIKRALESVTLNDIRGWFRHCGYAVATT
jgi:transposase